MALPMDYQSSLGTLDLILGVKYSISRLQIVAAYQQPLTQNNNSFFASNYPLSSPLSGFQTTNKFIRKGDVLVRLSYPFAIGKKLSITPSVLPIYHLDDDAYTDEMGVQQNITGSRGLTLNWNAYFDYQLDDKSVLQMSVSSPLIIRDERPDGLTRNFIVSLEYKISF